MLILQRKTPTQYGTFGQYIFDGVIFVQTLEKMIPAFPAGDYVLYRYFSPSHGYDVLRFTDPMDGGVLAARYIENHPGNAFFDTKGCVLVGMSRGPLDCLSAYPAINPKTGEHDMRHYLGTIPAILGSKDAFKKVMAEIPSGTPIKVKDATT